MNFQGYSKRVILHPKTPVEKINNVTVTVEQIHMPTILKGFNLIDAVEMYKDCCILVVLPKVWVDSAFPTRH